VFDTFRQGYLKRKPAGVILTFFESFFLGKMAAVSLFRLFLFFLLTLLHTHASVYTHALRRCLGAFASVIARVTTYPVFQAVVKMKSGRAEGKQPLQIMLDTYNSGGIAVCRTHFCISLLLLSLTIVVSCGCVCVCSGVLCWMRPGADSRCDFPSDHDVCYGTNLHPQQTLLRDTRRVGGASSDN
jgi:hypothetical protein